MNFIREGAQPSTDSDPDVNQLRPYRGRKLSFKLGL